MSISNLFLGNSLEVLKGLPDNSMDSVVTDPPYGLSFMGKKWDYDVPSVELWCEVLRVLKPGGHLLSFGGTRTYHRMVVNIEDAGFEIRDQIMWIYGSGFPKSHNIAKSIDKQLGVAPTVVGKLAAPASTKRVGTMGRPEHSGSGWNEDSDLTEPTSDDAKQWQGWGTALKPANEPIVVARKPLSESTVAKNVLRWGTGALNIDESRIEGRERTDYGLKNAKRNNSNVYGSDGSSANFNSNQGRWPANVLFDEEAAASLDEQSGISKSTKLNTTQQARSPQSKGAEKLRIRIGEGFSDSGGASRFFYVAKASKRERNAGVQELITWENQDQNLQALMVELSQQLKDIYDSTMLSLSDTEWSTFLSGNKLMDQFPLAFRSTMSTVTKLIIELKTSKSLVPSTTSVSTLDAIRMLAANGLSLAESAEYLSLLQETIIDEKTALVLGANAAVLLTLSKISALGKIGNVHSTVKPIKLMEYLIKLVTPTAGTVLDPFMGSGTTGVACMSTGNTFFGVEMDQSYLEIATKRINNAKVA